MKFRAAGAAIITTLALAGCTGSSGDLQEVRPLVNPSKGDFMLVAYDDASVQGALTTTADKILAFAGSQPLESVTIDDLNEDILEVTFVDETTNPSNYGGGSVAASILIRKNTATLAMAGEGGSCWGLKMSRKGSSVVREFASVFLIECTAIELLDTEPEWTADWPPRANPPEGFVPPTAPPDQQIPGGLTPEDLQGSPEASPSGTPLPNSTSLPSQPSPTP